MSTTSLTAKSLSFVTRTWEMEGSDGTDEKGCDEMKRLEQLLGDLLPTVL